MSIPNRFGYIVSKDQEKMIDEISDILKNDNLKIENVDFEIINKSKIKKIDDIIDGDRDEKN